MPAFLFAAHRAAYNLLPAMPETDSTTDVRQLIEEAGRDFDRGLAVAGTAAALDELRVHYFGRKAGLVPALFSRLKEVPKDQKKEVGDALNKLRDRIESELKENCRVMVLPLHSHLVGVPHRMNWFNKILDMLMARKDTIFVTPSQIADWYKSVEPAPADMKV